MKHLKSTAGDATLRILRILVLNSLFFLPAIDAFSTSIIVSGKVSGTWNADTVFVEGNLSVPPNETLNILPGTIVLFNAWFRLDVHGQILAKGTPGDTIVFTVPDTTGFASQTSGSGGWSGIRFSTATSQTDSSLFTYCSFKYGKAVGDSANCYGGAIQVIGFDKIRVSGCLIYHNYSFYSGGGIYLWDADISIKNCVFENNYSGNTGTIYGYGGGLCSLLSSPLVENNVFHTNTSTGVGGGASFDNSDPVFNNNMLSNNFSGLGGALGVLRSAPTGTMANNLVINNEAKFFGGGICCIRSFPVFSNLTVAGNQSAYGGGFYCNDSAVPSMYNSIIWGNTGLGNSVYIWDVRSAPNFYYCDIEDDTTNFEGSGGQEGYHGVYENNINSDPHFSFSGLSPYYLSGDSPCIDSGTPDPTELQLPESDINGASRVFNNRIDMGAYEYHDNLGIAPNNHKNSVMVVSPNPFAGQTVISLPISETNISLNVISILDIHGNCVRHLQVIKHGNSATWDGRNDKGQEVSPGCYFLRLSTPEQIITGKIIKGND